MVQLSQDLDCFGDRTFIPFLHPDSTLSRRFFPSFLPEGRKTKSMTTETGNDFQICLFVCVELYVRAHSPLDLVKRRKSYEWSRSKYYFEWLFTWGIDLKNVSHRRYKYSHDIDEVCNVFTILAFLAIDMSQRDIVFVILKYLWFQ